MKKEIKDMLKESMMTKKRREKKNSPYPRKK